MNRRKFIKAISMLAGAALVIPKGLFASKPVYTFMGFDFIKTSSLPDPNPDGGLTLEKLLKAKRIMDAEQLPRKAYRMMYISETALDRCILETAKADTFRGFKFMRTI